jgi:hypothetical protein
MPHPFKKPSILLSAFLKSLLFGYVTLISFLGALFLLQILSVVPLMPVEKWVIAVWGVALVCLVAFFFVVQGTRPKKGDFLLELLTVRKKVLLFDLAATFVFLACATFVSLLKKENPILWDAHTLSPYQFEFSFSLIIKFVFSSLVYSLLFYPFASAVYASRNFKKINLKKKILPLLFLILVNPIFVAQGTAYIALYKNALKFWSAHIECGARIMSISPASPADNADMQLNSVIQKIDNTEIHSPTEVVEYMSHVSEGKQLEILTEKGVYQLTPIKDVATQKMVIGVTLNSNFCTKNSNEPVLAYTPKIYPADYKIRKIGERSTLHTIQADGSNNHFVQLSDEIGTDAAAITFLPKTQELLVNSNNGIFAVNLKNHTHRQVYKGDTIERFEVSGDRKWVKFYPTSKEGSSDYVQLNLETQEVSPVTQCNDNSSLFIDPESNTLVQTESYRSQFTDAGSNTLSSQVIICDRQTKKPIQKWIYNQPGDIEPQFMSHDYLYFTVVHSNGFY